MQEIAKPTGSGNSKLDGISDLAAQNTKQSATHAGEQIAFTKPSRAGALWSSNHRCQNPGLQAWVSGTHCFTETSVKPW
jgi:hypothetical protein